MGVAYLWPPRLSGSYYPRKEVLVQIVSKKIRLAPGRFTVTTTKQNLPITLISYIDS